jgi:hypothetical protein
MKLKQMFAVIAGLLITTTPILATNGSVTVTAGNASPNPVCLGSSVSSTVTATVSNPSDDTCELKVNSRTWSWSADYGTCAPPDGDGSTTWSWVFQPPSPQLLDVVVTVTPWNKTNK